MTGLLDREPVESVARRRPGNLLPAWMAESLAAYEVSPERRAALRPRRQGPSLTLPSPDVRPGEPVRNPLAGLPGEPAYVHPDVAQRRLDEAMFALGFAGGIRPVARAKAGAVRYNSSHEQVSAPLRDPSAAPPRPPGPPEGSNASAFPAVDPEGRHLTAPWRAGRTSDGSFSPLPSEAPDYLLDYLAQRGVERDVPGSEFPRSRNGRIEGGYTPPPAWAQGRGEATARMASARIREGNPRGGMTEMHEVGHGVHSGLTGDAQMPRQVANELGRFLSAGGARVGSQAERNELFAEGLGTYLRNPELIWTRAPRAAAYFRSLVNTDEFLSRYFQLQTAAGLAIGAGAGLLGAGEGEAQ